MFWRTEFTAGKKKSILCYSESDLNSEKEFKKISINMISLSVPVEGRTNMRDELILYLRKDALNRLQRGVFI